MSADPIDGMCRRGRFDRSALPPLVDQLTPDEAQRLADLFHRAVDTRHQEMETSIEQGLGMLPRPIRRPVMKILGI